MPNGRYYRPYRLPGKYCCYLCRDLKDSEEFYKDCTRWNGCASRCKVCDNYLREVRRSGPDVKVGDRMVNPTRVDNRWAERQVQKRIDEIKSTIPSPVESTVYRVVQKDKYGMPVWIEKTITFEDGSVTVTFEKGFANR